jgi:hypothetical protein
VHGGVLWLLHSKTHQLSIILCVCVVHFSLLWWLNPYRTELDNVEKATEPLVGSDLYVVNEAYSLLHGWAEGSLKLADRTFSCSCEGFFSLVRNQVLISNGNHQTQIVVLLLLNQKSWKSISTCRGRGILPVPT